MVQAWRLWREGKGLELIDPSTGDSYSPFDVTRCIQVGLLCVQERAEDRPTMSSVVFMLGSENASLPQPKHPGFCLGRHPMETDSSSGKQDETVNQVTVTILDGRQQLGSSKFSGRIASLKRVGIFLVYICYIYLILIFGICYIINRASFVQQIQAVDLHSSVYIISYIVQIMQCTVSF